MSVYIVTKDNRLLRYDAPAGKSDWIQTYNDYYYLYWRNCHCSKCGEEQHKVLIAYVQKADIVSIGFERPAAIEGRMLNYGERNALGEIIAWLEKRKTLPQKMKRQLERLRSLAALCEQK